MSPASSYSGQPPLYAAQHQASLPASSSAAAFPPPPSSGASFQHGGPGAPPSSSAYALPPGTTGTLPAAGELPASQRTGLRLKGIGFGSSFIFHEHLAGGGESCLTLCAEQSEVLTEFVEQMLELVLKV